MPTPLRHCEEARSADEAIYADMIACFAQQGVQGRNARIPDRNDAAVFSRYAPFGNCVTTVSKKQASLDASFLVVEGVQSTPNNTNNNGLLIATLTTFARNDENKVLR